MVRAFKNTLIIFSSLLFCFAQQEDSLKVGLQSLKKIESDVIIISAEVRSGNLNPTAYRFSVFPRHRPSEVYISRMFFPGDSLQVVLPENILDADSLRDGDAITRLTIDWQEKHADKTVRKIQYSTLDDAGVLASHTIYHEQSPGAHQVITNHVQTTQLYTAAELKTLLDAAGFEVASCESLTYHADESPRLFVVARKR